MASMLFFVLSFFPLDIPHLPVQCGIPLVLTVARGWKMIPARLKTANTSRLVASHLTTNEESDGHSATSFEVDAEAGRPVGDG